MPDASQVYDTIHLDVTVGGGFDAAETRIDKLMIQLQKLGGKVTPINIDTRQIDRAIERLRGLQVPGAGIGGGVSRPTLLQPGRLRRGASLRRIDDAATRRYNQWMREYQKELLEGEGTYPLRGYARKSPAMGGANIRTGRGGLEFAQTRFVPPTTPGGKSTFGGAATPAATENLNKMNTAMEKTVTSATNLDKTMPQIPPAVTNVANSLKAAVPAAEAARVKLDALKLTGGNMKPALAEAATAQKNLKNAIVGATGKMPANSAELKKATGALKNLNGKLAEAKGQTNAYTLSWKNMTAVMGKVAFWMIATGAIYGSIRAFKSALDIIIKVDHAMADIRKVYQGAPGDIKPLRDDLIGLTVALGGNVEQVMEAAVGWARLGYERHEITRLMRTTMLAMNIAELGAVDATKLLTAAMQQFKIPATGAITVLDSWNELSNRTLATTRDLGDSVSIAGATFAQTGDSIHYLNAVTAALVQTMAKSGREVGTAMRTLGTFIYRPKTIKTVKRITGVEIEKAPTPERLPGEEQTEYTARMRDNMKSQSEILGEVAAKWDALRESEQISLAQSMAGVRRYNYFVALMENYDLVLKNLIISINSSGSAERENAIYMDTLQKKAERLKDTFVKLYVAGGDAGLTGILKGIIDGLRVFIGILGNVNLRTVALTAVVLVLTNAITKLIKRVIVAKAAAGGWREMLRTSISPMQAVSVGILAMGAAFTYLASRASKARGQLDKAITSLNKLTGEMERSEAAVKSAADNLDMLKIAEETLIAKVKARGGAMVQMTAEELALYKSIKLAKEGQVDILAEETGYREGLVELAYDEGRIGEANNRLMRKNNSTLAERHRKLQALEVDMESAKKSGTLTEQELYVFQDRFNRLIPSEEMIATAGDLGSLGAESYLKNWKTWVTKSPVIVVKDLIDIEAGRGEVSREINEEMFGAVFSGVSGAVTELGNTIQERGIKQTQDFLSGLDEVADTASGAGKEVDRLQLLIDGYNRTIAESKTDLDIANWALEEHRKKMVVLEDLYGDAVSQLPEYIQYKKEEYALMEMSSIAAGKYHDTVDMVMNKLIELGPQYIATAEDQIKFAETMRQLGADSRGAESDFTDAEIALAGWANTIKFAERAVDKLATKFRRSRDSISRVLPSRRDAKEFSDELTYVMEDLNKIVDNLNKQRDLTGEARISYFDIAEIVQLINMGETDITQLLIKHNILLEGQKELTADQLELVDALGAGHETVVKYAEQLNDEYDRLANTFQNIVDEGLFGIIMGEQTALDLAKELGREWASIALKTVTQPATEAFASGMGGAAYFMKHGKLPSALGGGIMDVKLTDGRVPVYDEAVAAGLASVATGQRTPGFTAAGISGSGVQGAGQGVAGAGAMGTIMPIAGGVMTGGLMGSGGGGKGAAFGSVMGGIGAAVSLIPGWGTVVGAGISMLGLLGNLFGGGPKHEEEDPYAQQQSAGIGERSLSIGSAGTVNNTVHMTIYYESSTDRENVSQLYDLMEEEGMARGMQVTGSAVPATV